jgi:hypothetical protein
VNGDKTYLPAQEAPPRTHAWLLQPHEHYRRPEGPKGAPRSGAQAPERVEVSVPLVRVADLQWSVD